MYAHIRTCMGMLYVYVYVDTDKCVLACNPSPSLPLRSWLSLPALAPPACSARL